MGTTNWARKGCLFLVKSLDQGLDVPFAVGTLHTVPVEARTGYMDDLLISRMVALFVLRRAIASSFSMSEMHPHLVVSTFGGA